MTFNVWEFFEASGAPPKAVEWARPYGSNIRRVWNECEHGELMVPIAGLFSAPLDLLLSATLDCVRSSLMPASPLVVVKLLPLVEQWSIGAVPQSGVRPALEAVIAEAKVLGARENSRQSPNLCITEAALGLGMAVSNAADPRQSIGALAHAIGSAAHARAATVRLSGAMPMVCEHVFDQALAEFAARQRLFMPWDVVAMGPLRQASRALAVRYEGFSKEEAGVVGVC